MFMTGTTCFLDPLEVSHSSFLFKWFNNPAITKYMVYGQRPETEDDMKVFLETDLANDNDLFIIKKPNDKKPIGFAGLYSISLTARSAEFRVLIGEQKYWGSGIGTEVTEMLLFHGFDRLNLNMIWLGVIDENQRAYKSYLRAGFTEGGRRRQALYRNSKYYDAIWMDILRSEYYEDFYDRHRKKFA